MDLADKFVQLTEARALSVLVQGVVDCEHDINDIVDINSPHFIIKYDLADGGIGFKAYGFKRRPPITPSCIPMY